MKTIPIRYAPQWNSRRAGHHAWRKVPWKRSDEKPIGYYLFWIHDKDPKGRPLDPEIVKAAEIAMPALTQYRDKEIGCESMINTMLQRAVDAASKAVHKSPIINPIAYLVSVYHRIVDRHLAREQRLIFVEDSVLEHMANAACVVSFEKMIHNRLLLRTVMDAMDPDTLHIFIWRLYGYSVNEIALELSVTPNSVSMRFSRGLKAVKKFLKIK